MDNKLKHQQPVTKRCDWVSSDPLYISYHDDEWGVPIYSEDKLFEFLLLEGQQAGLSWITILKKRAHYAKVYANFNPEKIARFSEKKVNALLQDSGIIRNKLKIQACIKNAQAYCELKNQGESFVDFVWQFTDGKPQQNHWKTLKEVPASTVESTNMSKAFKKKGFSFVGPTICYAFMQAVGMVNDHTTDCFRHKEIKQWKY